MLNTHLKQAIKIIDNLVYLTQEDIQDIGNVPKQDIFKRVVVKQKMLEKFDTTKSKIDLAISNLSSERNNSIDIRDILSDEENLSLGLLEDKMLFLKKVNKKYIKLVVSVSGFYLSLINKIIPQEMNGYKNISSRSSFLNLTA